MGNGLALVLATVNVILMAMLLGPGDFGYLSIVLAITGLIVIPADFGLTNTTAKFLSEKKIPADMIINTALCLKILIYAVITIIYFSILFMLKDVIDLNPVQFNLYLYIFPFILLGETMYRLSLGVFQGYFRMDLLACTFFALRALQLIICSLLVISGLGVTGAASGYGLASILVFLGSLAFLKTSWNVKPVMHVAKSLLGFSSYAFLSLAMYAIILWTDILVISFFFPAEYAGYYSIASKAAILVTTIPMAIESIMYPTVSAGYSNKDFEGTKKIFIKVVKVIFYTAGISSVFVIAVSYFGITIFLPQYIPAILPLIILTISFFIGTFANAYVSVLNGWNQPKITARITIIQALFNLVTNLIFVPVFGYVAASVTSLISFSIGTYLGFRAVNSLVGVKITFSDLKIHKEEIEILKQKIHREDKTGKFLFLKDLK